MTFLFVDYNQGIGGEYFCANISQSLPCIPLEFNIYDNGRTKVLDEFEQEFLKPQPNVIPKESPVGSYTVVPTHGRTYIASRILNDVKSIRIQMPTEERLVRWVKQQQINKVILAVEPTVEYFFGFLTILKQQATVPDFVKHARYGMTNVELILLSRGISPTQENIDSYVNDLKEKTIPEPNFDYDLKISYEDLVYCPEKVKQELNDVFGIKVVGNWLEKYSHEINSET